LLPSERLSQLTVITPAALGSELPRRTQGKLPRMIWRRQRSSANAAFFGVALVRPPVDDIQQKRLLMSAAVVQSTTRAIRLPLGQDSLNHFLAQVRTAAILQCVPLSLSLPITLAKA